LTHLDQAMITRLFYIISLVLISVPTNAQIEVLSDEESRHELFLSGDLTGITFLPLSTILIKHETSHYRLMGVVEYSYFK
jgi:hypothetical protein